MLVSSGVMISPFDWRWPTIVEAEDGEDLDISVYFGPVSVFWKG